MTGVESFMLSFGLGGFILFLDVCLDWPMMRKLDGGTHTGEVYITEPLEWQGAGSKCWLGQEKVDLEAKIRVG